MMKFYLCGLLGLSMLKAEAQNTFPATGNVGIGTTTPSISLQVVGGHIAAANNSGLNGFVQLWSDNSIMWRAGNPNLGLRFGSATDLAAGNYSEKMRISDAGFLGIGTTTPAFKVDILSPDNDGATRFRLANTVSTGANAPGSCPTIEVLGARGDGNTSFEGRFALGTRRTDGNPLATQTLGAVLFGGQYGTDNTFQSAKILYPASIQGIAEGSFTGSSSMPTAIAFYTGTTGNDVAAVNVSYGTEQMRITNTGSVGIGTSTPGIYKLAVNGSAIFTKAVVKLYANWPDYVFEKSYHLPPLKNIEEFIKANNHLPETPSAGDIEKNGIDLGQSQALLLKKIEELTLYVIDLDKKVEQLSRENEELKKRVMR